MTDVMYNDDQIENLIWWTPGAELIWDNFYISVDKLCTLADEAELPIVIIMHPTADIPKGSPFPHMKRFFRDIGNHDKIQQFYIVIESKYIFAPMIMKILETLINIKDKFVVVNSRAAALEKIKQTKDYK